MKYPTHIHSLVLCFEIFIKILYMYLSTTLFFFFFCFSGLQNMEIPKLVVQSELQLSAYTTATQDLSLVFDLHYRSQQCQILNPLSEARY